MQEQDRVESSPSNLRIKTPTEAPVYFAKRYHNNSNKNETYENALRIAKAQLKRYENDPEWNTSNNRNEAIEFLRNTKIPQLIKQIEQRKRTCQKVTNAITGTVRSVCGIQRHRTRKNRRSRKMTRRVR
jgi:hypothetical protein